jgi:amino acid adenylation domain-containing protein
MSAPAKPRAQTAGGLASIDVIEGLAVSAARRPGHIAVAAADAVLDYRRLAELSGRLAARLVTLGVGPEVCVGISLPRGAGELVALLATLKAGGAYVPLDPSHPAERLRLALEDARPQVLIAHPGSPLAKQAPPETQVLPFDDLERATADFTALDSVRAHDPDQLAYLLFTSGSTGRPKGVEIARAALANFLGAMARAPGLSADERLLAVTTTSFDIAALELFLPLVVGATVVIADRETVRDPRRLRRRLEADRISIMQATPATWRLLLEAGWTGDGKLRMLCGGEAMSPALADRLLAAGGELWNMYGPTEATVWCSLARILPGYDRITVGRPIDGLAMSVLDEWRAPLPPGREGEIWIGGKGLARGYRGRPDLTAERFVPDPNGRPGERLYRTGDQGRQLPDGRIECLGRLDQQVKIGGFRIELGEVEAVLRAVPGVREALVVADLDGGRDPRLVAYWVGDAARFSLLEATRRKLPPTMVPQAFVPLEVFPLNTNGKIDRKRLPAPEIAADQSRSPPGPRNETEARIAAIWAQLLGLARVPVDQSFFDLGATSMLAIQAAVRMQQELGVEIPLESVFTTPTVQDLARHVGEGSSPDRAIAVKLRPGAPGRPALHCLLGVTLYQDLALALDTDFSVYGMHVSQRNLPREQEHVVPELARRYVDLVRQQQPRGPYHLLGLCFGGIVAYEAACQLQAAGESIALVTVLDAILPEAVTVNELRWMVGQTRRVWHEPRKMLQRLRAKGGHLARRLAALTQLGQPAPPPSDLPLEGPEYDALIATWAAATKHLQGRLLVVRATSEPTSPWLSLRADLGWSGRADQVVVHDIAAHHLQILREPHVRSLARALARETERATAGG